MISLATARDCSLAICKQRTHKHCNIVPHNKKESHKSVSVLLLYSCDIPYTNCGDKTQCFNGGKCQTEASSAEIEPCQCATGYSGQFCELYGHWDDDDDTDSAPPTAAGDSPQLSAGPATSKKKPTPILLGAMGVGAALGLVAFFWNQQRQQRRLRANWLAASHSGTTRSSSSVMDVDRHTYVNVI